MRVIEGWTETLFGNLVTLVKGVSYASEDYCSPGEGALFITIKCVSKAGGFKPEGIKYFNGQIPDSQLLHPGDLLIANTDLTRTGDIVGCPIIVPSVDAGQITMSMDLSKLVEDATRVDRSFLYYTLMTDPVRRFMKDHASGSTVLHLQTSSVPSLQITIPNAVPEQAKIAEILCTVDKAIEQTEGLIAKHQRIKVALTKDLLTRGIDEHGNLRSESTHKFKDSPLGRIPVEWKAGSILDFASRARQAILTGPFGAQLGAEDFVEEGVPVLRIGNVQAGFVDQSNLLFASQQKAERLSRYRVYAGDLLFARQGATTGRNSLAGPEEDGFLINYHIIRVAIDQNKCSPTFLYAAFNSEMVRSQVEREKGKGTREGVNTATLMAFVLPIPPIEEQIRLSDVIDAHRRHTDDLLWQGNKLRALKAALTHDLLTGRRRVTALMVPGPKREKSYAQR